MTDKYKAALEYCNLLREFSRLPANAETPEQYAPIKTRKQYIITRIKELKKVIREEKDT